MLQRSIFPFLERIAEPDSSHLKGLYMRIIMGFFAAVVAYWESCINVKKYTVTKANETCLLACLAYGSFIPWSLLLNNYQITITNNFLCSYTSENVVLNCDVTPQCHDVQTLHKVCNTIECFQESKQPFVLCPCYCILSETSKATQADSGKISNCQQVSNVSLPTVQR